MKIRTLLTAVALAAALVVTPGAQASETHTYGPDFEAGPTGGDSYNYMQREPSGRITAARVHANPGGISCGGQAGWVTHRVTHTVDGVVDKVVIDFTEAAVDPFITVLATVRDQAGNYVGSTQQQGAVDSGSLIVDVNAPNATALTIDFGLQLSSACPSADAGTIRFTQVTVNPDESGGEPGDPGGPTLPEGVGPSIVSTPGDFAKGYSTPVMVAQKGGTLTYMNFDAASHDVVARQEGPDGLPLFKSALIGLGRTAAVEGLDRVEAGSSYAFFCSLHPNMTGTLVIV